MLTKFDGRKSFFFDSKIINYSLQLGNALQKNFSHTELHKNYASARKITANTASALRAMANMLSRSLLVTNLLSLSNCSTPIDALYGGN